MIDIKRKQDCCGCTACEQICGREAISMKSDSIGFLYPVIDEKLCNDCQLCNKICPINKELSIRIPQHIYALKNKDLNVRLQSSSGGVFSILAKETISRGGVVYGAIFDREWNVVHSRIDNLDDIVKFQGSKYVQSKLGETFKQIKIDLNSGKKVLFSGTPCQVAGLLSYLRKKYENLTTVDFVCHGVPNPKIWNDYLMENVSAVWQDAKVPFSSSQNHMSLIKDIRFRDKSKGWQKYRFVLSIAKASAEGDGSSVSSCLNEYCWDNEYMSLFLNDYILRPSCHECHFRNGKSGADYTIADYWGIERFYPDFFDDNGVSLFFDYRGTMPDVVKESSEYIETKYEEACYGNYAITNSWPYNPYSGLFYFYHCKLGLNIHNSIKLLKITEQRISEVKRLKCRIKDILHRIKQKI